jgi:hypothetical protein
METAIGVKALTAWQDAKVFGRHFQPLESWAPWMTVWRVLFGLPLSPDERALFAACTGRTALFVGPLGEAWFLCGRRSGKSRFLALLAVILACFRDYRPFRSPGERVVIMVLAVDRDQASVIFNYARALLTETPILKGRLEHETAEALELKGGVSIEVHVSNYKSVRGRTAGGILCDEICFWQSSESRNPGAAVIAAARPSLTTIPGAPLICASSTYDRSGVAYETFERHYGHNESNVMVWRADTRTMNPSFRQSEIDTAMAKDAMSAGAEYYSQWLSHVSAAYLDDIINSNICRDRKALPPAYGMNYCGFVDSSGGQHDSMVLAIGHKEKDRVVLDRLVVAKAPFSPDAVTAEFAQVLSSYRVNTVIGDRYASQWVVSAFSKHGITYRPSELTKSELYSELTPLLSGGLVELLDDSRLLLELRQLERRPGRNGRGDIIDHRPGGKDDIANAAAGCLVGASRYWADAPSSPWLKGVERNRHVSGLSQDPFQPREKDPLPTHDGWGRKIQW